MVGYFHVTTYTLGFPSLLMLTQVIPPTGFDASVAAAVIGTAISFSLAAIASFLFGLPAAAAGQTEVEADGEAVQNQPISAFTKTNGSPRTASDDVV